MGARDQPSLHRAGPGKGEDRSETACQGRRAGPGEGRLGAEGDHPVGTRGAGLEGRQVETAGEPEIASKRIGEMVMDGLRGIDSVAYIRFASVYRDFSEARDFEAFASTVQEAANHERG